MKLDVERRSLLKGGATLAAGTALAGPLSMFSQQAHAAAPGEVLTSSPYGPVSPKKDLSTGLYLLELPNGFSYKSFSWYGDMMSNGQLSGGRHDGMGVISYKRVGRGYEIVVCRNQEMNFNENIKSGSSGNLYGTIGASGVYDNIGTVSGGNTNLIFRNGNWVEAVPSLGGTIRNCAGGTTPWGSWLSCEETHTDLTEAGGLKHGYIFEVPADASKTTGKPIVDMGRFSHEAVCVDPKTSYVYETEDDRFSSGFYRFVPNDTSMKVGSLEQGGKLYMAKVVGDTNTNWMVPEFGDSYKIEWVLIDDPDLGRQSTREGDPFTSPSGTFIQGWDKGGARMSRGEGCWWSDKEDVAYIVDTAGGVDGNGVEGRGEGAVWCYDPRTETMTCVFASKSNAAANNPDNITVSPRGGLLLCEDGGGFDATGTGRQERLLGLLPTGLTFEFARNNCVLEKADLEAAGKNLDFWEPGDYRRSEWAGACFDPTGRILFVNMQGRQGITYAITGPWRKGPF